MPSIPAITGLAISAAEVLRLASTAGTQGGTLSLPFVDFVLISESFAERDGGDYHAQMAASFLAGRLPDTGIIAEVDIFNSDPYLVARALASLDILSGGRAGFAPVARPANDKNPGYATVATDASYVNEFINAVASLWNNWQPGALVRDWESNRYIDNNLLLRADYNGQYFSIAGPLPTPTAIQSEPLFIARSHASHSSVAGRAAAVIGSRQDAPPASDTPLLIETKAGAQAPDVLPEGCSGLLLHVPEGLADWNSLARIASDLASRYSLSPREPGKTLAERFAGLSRQTVYGDANV